MNYNKAREMMQIGDLMAFGGKGLVSKTIKKITYSKVSHVGTILYSYVAGQRLVQIIESTSLGEGFAGVKINRMSDHLKNYDGDIWWYPLRRDVREKFEENLFTRFVLKMKGRKYDKFQAVMSVLDIIPDTSEDLDKLFCSELIAEAYERARIINNNNASEMTPQDVIDFNLYDEAVHLKSS